MEIVNSNWNGWRTSYASKKNVYTRIQFRFRLSHILSHLLFYFQQTRKPKFVPNAFLSKSLAVENRIREWNYLKLHWWFWLEFGSFCCYRIALFSFDGIGNYVWCDCVEPGARTHARECSACDKLMEAIEKTCIVSFFFLSPNSRIIHIRVSYSSSRIFDVRML